LKVAMVTCHNPIEFSDRWSAEVKESKRGGGGNGNGRQRIKKRR
jgi:hypothetical protein